MTAFPDHRSSTEAEEVILKMISKNGFNLGFDEWQKTSR
jgi:hypothetical protein